jgi:outer membrane protein assembly factor BamB
MNDTPEFPHAQPSEPKPSGTSIRLWPAILIVALGFAVTVICLVWISLGEANLAVMYVGASTPALSVLFLAAWWMFASRARWRSKFALLALFILLALATAMALKPTLHFAYFIFAVPIAAILAVAWWGVSGRLPLGARRAGLVAVCLLAFGVWFLLRSAGTTGAALPLVAWRWAPTAEQTFLASLNDKREPIPPAALSPLPDTAEWPGFRGPNRDGRADEASLAGDWRQTPPRELWRRRLGPAWSSMSIAGQRLFTQEQRGEHEAVVCYSADTGDELWARLDESRFDEAASGAGPRATPTYDRGRIYALGAKGLLNCLDAGTGESIWRRDVAKDHKIETPMWGFSSSPLVVGDLVYVLGGGKGKALLAYDRETGEPKWSAGDGEMGYSSPQLAGLEKQDQILVLNEAGLAAFDPLSGESLWFEKLEEQNQATLQPLAVGESTLLVGMQGGLRQYSVKRQDEKWRIDHDWTGKRLRPSFNDIAVCGDRAIGIDGAILACVDLGSGKLIWKGGRYGRGQLLLAGDRLIVQAESGDVALVDALADKHVELGRISALHAKTWNHPALVGNRLFVRNGEEMACYELPH